MNTREMEMEITLRLNQSTIERAKQFAAMRKSSLSKIVENYLQSLTTEPDISISPYVKSMATGVKIPVDLDYKEDYARKISDLKNTTRKRPEIKN
jgi:hypothetical protein